MFFKERNYATNSTMYNRLHILYIC